MSEPSKELSVVEKKPLTTIQQFQAYIEGYK